MRLPPPWKKDNTFQRLEGKGFVIQLILRIFISFSQCAAVLQALFAIRGFMITDRHVIISPFCDTGSFLVLLPVIIWSKAIRKIGFWRI